jgi:hypothetical protein
LEKYADLIKEAVLWNVKSHGFVNDRFIVGFDGFN